MRTKWFNSNQFKSNQIDCGQSGSTQINLNQIKSTADKSNAFCPHCGTCLKQPLDYADNGEDCLFERAGRVGRRPRYNRVLEARRAKMSKRQERCDYVCDALTAIVLTVLMCSSVFFGVAGVYFWGVDGLLEAIMPLSIGFGSFVLLLGGYFMSARVRRILDEEV